MKAMKGKEITKVPANSRAVSNLVRADKRDQHPNGVIPGQSSVDVKSPREKQPTAKETPKEDTGLAAR